VATIDAPTIDPRLYEELLQPFAAATMAALEGMTGIEVQVVGMRPMKGPLAIVAPAAIVQIDSSILRVFDLSIPPKTAVSLAQRLLAEAGQKVDDAMVQDCVCELANVVAGQAKALLADGRFRFTFRIPQPPGSASWPGHLNWFVLTFACEWGDFTVRLCLDEMTEMNCQID
jgi:CheY-specific phosphatase CheX